MATLRFTAAERPKLLARAVIDTCAVAAAADYDPDELVVGLGELDELAQALDGSDARRFDELLSEHFRDVALAALGRPVPKVGVDPETGAEAAT